MPQRNGFRPDRPGSSHSEGAVGFEERGPSQAGESMNEIDREDGGRIDQMIARNPMSSILTSFGLGLGFGLMVTLLISRRREESWLERTLPESMQHLPARLKRVPESLASYAPASWKHS
jgi:hypothetical protein